MALLDEVIKQNAQRVKHRVWICSDLQHWDPEETRLLLETALADYHALALPCEQIWYLGDTTDGGNRENLRQVVTIQADLFAQLERPIYFTFGNHDFDDFRKNPGDGMDALHAWRILRERPYWKLMEHLEDFYFTASLGDYRLYFFGDHAAPDGSWIVTHGRVHGDAGAYPHSPEKWQKVREQMAGESGPVISIGHYAYPGGNRPSDLMGHLLPLPDTVRAHFYGHAHLGEERLLQEHVYRKIAYANHQFIPQIDVASLERRKGNFVRSVFLEIDEDDTFGIYFRNHDLQIWEEAFFLDPRRRP